MTEIGLFPLALVLLPTERVPLHIFEPRYKELVAECVEEGEEFGLVLAAGDGAVHEVGTRAAVTEVLDELEDGSMNIIVEGGDRFRLLELTHSRSFTTGVVEEVVDEDDPPDETEADRAFELFGQLAETAGADVDAPARDSPLLDFELAARVDFGTDAKQELLASISPRERMARLVSLLETAIETVRLERELQERASGNGKVSPLEPE
jgi:Lon protease-like protein